jgi:hypothetical protein
MKQASLAVTIMLGMGCSSSSDGPHITSVSPEMVMVAEAITITGTEFCGSSGVCAEADINIQLGTDPPYFNVMPQMETATQVVALIPADVGTGNTQLVMTVNGNSSNGVSLDILPLTD